MREQPQHEHDLGTVRLAEAALERLGDARRGEVLVLDIDRAARRGGHVEIELLDLAYRRQLAARRQRARDADVDIGRARLELVRPRIGFNFGRA